MATTLSFTPLSENDPTVLYTVNVTDYQQQPEYDADGRALLRRKIVVSGTAILTHATKAYENARALCRNTTGRVKNWNVTVDSVVLCKADQPDAENGPYIYFNLTEVKGTKTFVLQWTANTSATIRSDVDDDNSNEYAPISHRWAQTFSIDSVGCITRSVRGSITVDMSTTGAVLQPPKDGTLAYAVGVAPHADLFRYAIVPEIPDSATQGNWRRESQTYAYNESGTALSYEVTDVQVRLKLPKPAKTGNCSFTYDRQLSSYGFATLTFNCDLEGEINGDTRGLINAAVQLSTMRITPSQAQILSISVTESDMLTRSKISMTITARAFCTDDPDAATPSITAVPLSGFLGRQFSVTRPDCAIMPLPYGTRGAGFFALSHSYQNLLSANVPQADSGTVKVAKMFKVTYEPPCTDTTTVAIITDTTYNSIASANDQLNVGPAANTVTHLTASNGATADITAVSAHTNMRMVTKINRLSTMYRDTADYVYQIGKPYVVIEEQVITKKMNVPPARTMRPIPAEYIVVEEDWKVNFGNVDGNGQRTFVGVWTRTMQAYDIGSASAAYTTQSNASATKSYRTWWAPNDLIVPAAATGFTNAQAVLKVQNIAKNILETQDTTGALPVYSTGTSQPLEDGFS